MHTINNYFGARKLIMTSVKCKQRENTRRHFNVNNSFLDSLGIRNQQIIMQIVAHPTLSITHYLEQIMEIVRRPPDNGNV